MRRILDAIDSALDTGQTVYVHCWGGVGRTGTVIGCWLVRHGRSGQAALREVATLYSAMSEAKRRRHPRSPETESQRRMIAHWETIERRALASASTPDSTSRRDTSHTYSASHARGCLLGGAVGDALGAPVEFLSWKEIERRYGPDGIHDVDEAYGRVGAITDDTQLTLFTAEGVLRGIVRGNLRGIGGPSSTLPYAYMRWLYTQDGKLPLAMEGSTAQLILGEEEGSVSWLLALPELHHRRAPGNTCLGALRSLDPSEGELATNDSKGCGGVMRVAPIALIPDVERESAFALACEAAAITHGHPTGRLAAGAFVWLLACLRGGMSLERAVEDTIARVSREPDHAETVRALEAALALHRRGQPPTPELVESLGGGWVAEEALAIAVYAALAAEGDFERGVRIAVNHSGDSDSTGSMAGQIIGVRFGEAAIPRRWLARLELRDVIASIADDLVAGYRDDEEWWARYPGC
jgi:ADP-ribosylglycohydrolase